LRALLLQAFYSVRSERQLVEQLDYNLLFRWFVGLGMDDAVWNHAVFSKNRDPVLNYKDRPPFVTSERQRLGCPRGVEVGCEGVFVLQPPEALR
jgi:hypothetical protein